MFRKTDIRGVLHPIFTVSRLLGMFPFTDGLELSLAWSAFSVVIVVLMVTNVYIYATIHILPHILVHSSLLCYVMLLSSSVIFNVIISCRSRDRWKYVLSSVSEVEEDIKKKAKDFSYSQSYMYLDLFFRATFIFIQILIHILWPPTLKFSSAVSFYLTDIIINWAGVEHIAFVSYIGYCFSILSRSLRRDNAVPLIGLHRSLVEISYNSRPLFDLKCFNVVSSLYAALLLDLFLALMPQWKGRTVYTYIFILNRFIQKSYELWKHMSVLNWFYRKENQFNYRLFTLVMEDETDSLCHEVSVKNQLAMKYKSVYTAAKFFTLDFQVVHSVYATVTNYLTLILGLS